MRRIVSLAMFVLFIATIVVAVVEGRLHPGRAEHHVLVAGAFIIVTVIHIVLNRKALARQLGRRDS
ncbi:MAG TPA: hypothetical protein P5119_08820 [Candidatus Aminicenantes bacterium]|nr:hypothetical protein [Candidatus Aminicenantes bacterium]HRY65428.1 hypothetical protein [Candidatus Aminicenantes bacterium]HRZ72104.1 hypothetical protein [Candidatus Aminicenantes bacterium]